MARGRRIKRFSLDSFLTLSDLNSIDSKEVATQTYFDNTSDQPSEQAAIEQPPSEQVPPEQALAVVPSSGPSYTSTRTWKSPAIKDQEEYERLRQRVRHFAPEQFKPNAKPGRGPCEIVPRNVIEWRAHQLEMLNIAEAENNRNCELLKAKIEAQPKIPKQHRKLKSAFGEGGKVFTDGLSPVLGLPTIWSAEHLQQTATWPSKAEFQWNGDSRECSLAKTKCGRYLPPPRTSAEATKPMREPKFIKPLSMDETGPVFSSGPYASEVHACNLEMDNDPAFEAHGAFFVGAGLMEEVGEWKPAFIPDWRQEQLTGNARAMVLHEDDGMMGTPGGGAAMWNGHNMMDASGDERQMWY